NPAGTQEQQASPALTQQFAQFAHATSVWTGNPWTFLLAVAVVIVWVATGPLFNYSDTWQLIINTGTTIVTFLMVFLIQNTQNRDTLAIQLKLSELVLAMKGAENKFARLKILVTTNFERYTMSAGRVSIRRCVILKAARLFPAGTIAVPGLLRIQPRRRRGNF